MGTDRLPDVDRRLGVASAPRKHRHDGGVERIAIRYGPREAQPTRMRPTIAFVRVCRERCAATSSTHLPGHHQSLGGSTGIPVSLGRSEGWTAVPWASSNDTDMGRITRDTTSLTPKT